MAMYQEGNAYGGQVVQYNANLLQEAIDNALPDEGLLQNVDEVSTKASILYMYSTQCSLFCVFCLLNGALNNFLLRRPDHLNPDVHMFLYCWL